MIDFEHIFQMPAVNEIDPEDFHRIMNNRLFDFWLVGIIRFRIQTIRFELIFRSNMRH